MFLRLLIRAALRRKQRTAGALAAMTVAAAAATAILLLFTDVQSKLRAQFRNYGANVVVVAKSGQLPPNAMDRVRRVLGERGLAVPFAYVVARTSESQAVVVAGTDMWLVRKLASWWEVTGWPVSAHDALDMDERRSSWVQQLSSADDGSSHPGKSPGTGGFCESPRHAWDRAIPARPRHTAELPSPLSVVELILAGGERVFIFVGRSCGAELLFPIGAQPTFR